MRNEIRLIAQSMVCLLLFAKGAAVAGSSTTKTLQASVRIVHPPQITEDKAIEFGQIEPGKSDGTVRVTPSHQRFVTGDVKARLDFHAGRFKIRGESNTTYHIQIPDQSVSNDEGTGGLNVTDFEIFSKTAGSVTTVGEFDNGGKDILRIGGTLQVPAGSPEGRYGGDLVINIHY